MSGIITASAKRLKAALAASSGSTTVGYGARTVSDKLADLPSAIDAGAQPDGATPALAALNAAIAAATGGELRLPAGDYLLSSAPTNPLGVQFSGPGRLLQPIAGGNRQLNQHGDDGQHVFGQEYLYAAHIKLRNRSPFLVVFSGDSTTAGDSISDPNLKIDVAVRNQVGDCGFAITTANRGQSGQHTEQWRTTWLAGDMALSPDLLVLRWGINDPGWGRSITDFATSLRGGLATIRASRAFGSLPIILMTPNGTSDTPNGRDERWYEQVRLVVRRAARDFQCAFIDTYALWQDSRVAAGAFMDNPFGDGRAIHPLDVMNCWIAGAIAQLLVPKGLYLNNVPSSSALPSISTGPQSFGLGVSWWRAYAWTINSVVVDGALMNVRTADGISMQTVWPYNAAGRPCVRTSDTAGTGWRDWVSAPPTTLALSNGWTNQGRDLTYDKQGGQVLLTGRIGGGATTIGTVIATLPPGYRPAYDCYFPVACGTGLASVGVVNVTSTGNISVISLPSNVLLDLSACHFTTY